MVKKIYLRRLGCYKMEIGEWMEELAYGDKSFKEKVVWVTMKGGGKLGMCLFAIPLSMMLPNADGRAYKIAEWRGKTYVIYRMTKGVHNSATWGKKKADGTKMFKSSKVYGNQSSSSGGSSGRTRGSKKYFCKKCGLHVDIERDEKNNAYCVDCGNKMFG